MDDARATVLGLGIATVDELLVLEHHPRINEKYRILSRLRQGGGLTATALVAAARMGCRCEYLLSLGKGELSVFLRRELSREGIRLIENNDDPDVEPFYSIILTERDTGERSILWDNSKAHPPHISDQEKRRICNAGCLFVDHVYAEAIVDAVRDAREAGVPVVGDFERTTPRSLELMAVTDHIILPLAYARQVFGSSGTVEELVEMMAAAPGREAACVTDGSHGAWYASGVAPSRVLHQPIFPMARIVDTTGCGDVFHGVYAAGVVLGWPLEERIRRASAAAALKTQQRGAQAGAPTFEEMARFLGFEA